MLAATLIAGLLAVAPTAVLEVSPRAGNVGDPLEAKIVVTLPPGFEVTPGPVGPELGEDVSVIDGAWQPVAEPGRALWTGRVAAYRTGRVEIPPVAVAARSAAGSATALTEPVALEIASVLKGEDTAEGAEPAIADLKPPASIPPDWRPLIRAIVAVLLLAVVAALAWLAYRRFAPRLAAAAAPVDPFRRLPPHEWAYEELRRLLASRLAEEHGAARFYEELSRVVKMYLGARFRADLMERTTAEAADTLDRSGAPRQASVRARALLECADRVKFAREAATLADCRQAVDEAYAIVDGTKVATDAAASGTPARGAA